MELSPGNFKQDVRYTLIFILPCASNPYSELMDDTGCYGLVEELPSMLEAVARGKPDPIFSVWTEHGMMFLRRREFDVTLFGVELFW
jgi:hypothetical protein